MNSDHAHSTPLAAERVQTSPGGLTPVLGRPAPMMPGTRNEARGRRAARRRIVYLSEEEEAILTMVLNVFWHCTAYFSRYWAEFSVPRLAVSMLTRLICKLSSTYLRFRGGLSLHLEFFLLDSGGTSSSSSDEEAIRLRAALSLRRFLDSGKKLVSGDTGIRTVDSSSCGVDP